MNGSDPKLSARELLEEAHPALVGLSHWIHANPEIGFQETLASGWVAEWLTTGGFEVETGVAGLPTAVIGHTGPGPFHVAICVEYDALPEVGHACGHNVIAAASVGAGLALASVAEELGLRVTVLGTPAEETGGGKLMLIGAGAFDGVHAAMMVHPWPTDVAMPSIIAINQLEVTYTGREAHAAGFPQHGLNAADALVVAQTAIGLLRQQLLPTDRVHGIVTRGGDAPNIIPAHTTALFMVRAHDRARLAELTGLVTRCFEAGALATGTQVSVVEGTAYSNMIHDPDLAALYRYNAELLGRVFDDTSGSPVSTDMGDVSLIVPSIHPMIGIDSDGAVNHQKAFADACATPSADQAILDGAVAMTWTVIDAVQDGVLRGRLMSEALAREALVLDTEAQDLTEAAVERLDEATAIRDEALPDEVSGESASDAEALEIEADDLEQQGDAVATTDPEEAALLAARALALDAQAQEFKDEAEIEAGDAADLAGAATLMVATAADLADEADILAQVEPESLVHAAADDLVEGDDVASGESALSDEAAGLTGEAEMLAETGATSATEVEALAGQAGSLEDEATTLAAGAGTLAATSDAALDEVATDATVALDAAEEAAGLEAVADTLAEEAGELAAESAELSAEADALADEAVAIASSDPDAAEVLAATAFEFETRAQETADEAASVYGQSLEIEADAEAAEDLAEVATEAAEDAAVEAVEVAPFAIPPAPAAAPALGKVHADWEQQFLMISAHATWEDEYARMLGETGGGWEGAASEAGPSAEAGDAASSAEPRSDARAPAESAVEGVAGDQPVDEVPPVEDAWYSGAPDGDAAAAAVTHDAEATDAADASAGSSEETLPETRLGDFEWIPASPDHDS